MSVELIVKVPEEIYNSVMNNERPAGHVAEMTKALYYGKLLPAGHGKLVDIGRIDEDRLESDNPVICISMDGCCIEAVSLDYLNSLPAIVEADRSESEE